MTREEAIKVIHKMLAYTDLSVRANLTADMVDACHLAIKALEQESRWIPVNERLPEQYEEVIVTDIETSDTYQSRYIGDGDWECDNGLFKNRIIAWQPKSKPYKVESEPPESEIEND